MSADHQGVLALLHRANQIANERFTAALGHDDLTIRQIQVLAAIAANEGASQTQIVSATAIDRSTLADMMRRLLRAKLIERRRSRADARAYVLKLTASGKQALEAGMPVIETVENSLVGPKDKENLVSLLEQLVARAS